MRKYTIWIVLVAVCAAAWWAANLDDEMPTENGKPTASRAARKNNPAASADPSQALAIIARGLAPRPVMAKLRNDPFAGASFQPPPPPPPPPPKPTAPPLRFKYQGLLQEGDARAVFLDNGGQLLIARTGDTLGNEYRVLSISENSMQVEYLPLAMRQTLNFGK